MLVRFAIALVAAAAMMASARAADYVEAPAYCDCGSDMITVYDYEPGVVTRQWKADCGCGDLPVRRPRVVALPVQMPTYEPIIDPWRRW